MNEDTAIARPAPARLAQEGQPLRWTRRQVTALVVLCLAALLDTIDVTVVNVAMPAIRNALHFSEGGLASHLAGRGHVGVPRRGERLESLRSLSETPLPRRGACPV